MSLTAEGVPVGKNFYQNKKKKAKKKAKAYINGLKNDSTLPSDQLSYYSRIEEFLATSPFETNPVPGGEEDEFDDGLLFVNNVFREMDEGLVTVAQDSYGSSVLLKLLSVPPASRPDNLAALLAALAKNVEVLVTHKWGSRVLQKLLEVIAPVATEKPDTMKEIKEPLSDLVKTLASSKEDTAWMKTSWNPYGTHVLRALFPLLSAPIMVSELGSVVSGLINDLSKDKDLLTDCCFHTCASPVLQALLAALPAGKGRAGFATFLWSLLGVTEEDDVLEASKDTLMEMARNPVGSRTLEAIVRATPASLHPRLHQLFLATASTLERLLADSYAGYVLQGYLDALTEKPSTELAVSALEAFTPQALSPSTAAGAHVLIKLVGAAARVGAGQKLLIRSLAAATDTTAPEKRKNLLPALIFYHSEDLDAEPGPAPGGRHVSPLGCGTSAALLKFRVGELSQVVESLTAMSDESLIFLAGHPAGARILSSFFDHAEISVKAKGKLIKRLHPALVKLAKTPGGSRVIEAAHSALAMPGKEAIAKVLAPHVAEVGQSVHGRHVLTKTRAAEYARHGEEEWRAAQDGAERKVAMFADLFEGSTTKVAAIEDGGARVKFVNDDDDEDDQAAGQSTQSGKTSKSSASAFDHAVAPSLKAAQSAVDTVMAALMPAKPTSPSPSNDESKSTKKKRSSDAADASQDEQRSAKRLKTPEQLLSAAAVDEGLSSVLSAIGASVPKKVKKSKKSKKRSRGDDEPGSEEGRKKARS